MKTPTPKKYLLPLFVLSFSWPAVFSSSLQAQSAQTWNNAAATGSWNTSDANWNGSSWTNNNNAVFGSTSGTTVTTDSNVVVNDITFTTTGYTIDGAFSLGSDLASTVTVTTDTATISANISDNEFGASSLTKSGSGTLVLSGSNSYSGGTVLSAGTLALNSSYAVGTGTLTISGGTLTNTSGTTVTLATNNAQKWTKAFTYTGSDTLNLGTGSVYMTLSETVTVNSGNLIIGGVISASSSSYGITKDGSGTLTLNGLNTYTYATIILGGTLSVNTLANGGVASSIGASASSGWAFQLKNGATLLYTGTGSTTDRSLYIDVAGTIENDGSGALVFSSTSGGIGNNTDTTGKSNKTITLTGTNADANTIALRIVDPTTGKTTSIIKSGSGFWALTGANTYTGTTTINAGVLSVSTVANGGTTSSLGAATSDASNLVLAGGTLQYAGTATGTTDRLFTITTDGGAIDGSGAGIVFTNTGALAMSGSGSRTLTLTGTSTANALAAQISDNGGATSLVKNGSGTWVLSGSNSYSGGTTLSAGGLTIANANALGTGTLTITGGAISTASGASITLATNNAQVWSGNFYYGGGTLDLGSGSVTLTASRYVTISSGNLIVDGVISGSGYNLTKQGTGTLTLTGSNTFTGALLISSGAVVVTSINNGGVASSIGAGPKDSWALQIITGGTLVYTGTGSTTDRAMIIDTAGTIENDGSGALVFTSTNSVGNNPSSSGTANRTITLTGTNTDANSFALKISDPTTTTATTLLKAGTGYWLISGTSNVYSGTTSVQNGTLAFSSVASGTNAQSLGSGSTITLGVAATSSGTLQYMGSTGTLDKNIYAYGNGLNTIENSGSGLLTLSGSIVKNGTVLVLNGGTSGILVSGVISGSDDNSDLYVTGGTTTLTALNTYNGPTWVYGGGVLVNGNASGALPTTTSLVLGGTDNSNGAFDLDGNNQTVAGLSSQGSGSNVITNNGASTATLTVTGGGTYSGSITDGAAAAALTVTGGNLVLDGSNDYTGATTVTGGTLSVNGSLGESTVTVSSAATLTGSGSIAGDVTVESGVINGSGLSLNGAATLSGSSTLSGVNTAHSVTVSGGTTTLTGTTTTTNSLAVSTGATLDNNGVVNGNMNVSGLLKGNGTLNGNLALSGTLAPGNSAGITTINGDLTMDSSAVLAMEVAGTSAGTTYDQIQVSGDVTLAGTLDLSALSGLSLGDTITLIDNTGTTTTTSGYFTEIITSGSTYTISGSSSTYTLTISGTEYLLNYAASADEDSVYNDVTLTVVPEPATWAMLLGGIGMLLGMQHSIRRKA